MHLKLATQSCDIFYPAVNIETSILFNFTQLFLGNTLHTLSANIFSRDIQIVETTILWKDEERKY